MTVGQLANALWAWKSGEISFAAFRVFLAAFEMMAIRSAAARTRRIADCRDRVVPCYGIREVAKLTRLKPRTIQRAMRELKLSGLIEFSTNEIVIATEPLEGADSEWGSLAGLRSGRRPIPVPRPVLRFLARHPQAGLTKVALAYLVRGLSIGRGSGVIGNRGTVKASWIACVFGLSLRAVRYAQRDLQRAHWISKDTGSVQRKLNRDGAYFVINLDWCPPADASWLEPGRLAPCFGAHKPMDGPPLPSDSGRKGKGRVRDCPCEGIESTQSLPFVNRDRARIDPAPPLVPESRPVAPPRKDRETSNEEKKHQEAPCGERAGVDFRSGKGRYITEALTATPRPSIRNILVDDLHRLSRMQELYLQAVAACWLRHSEAGALNFLAAAVRARDVNGDPVRVFVGIVRRGLWSHITQAQEDQARRALTRARDIHPQWFRLPIERRQPSMNGDSQPSRVHEALMPSSA